MPELDASPAGKPIVLALCASAADTGSLVHLLTALPPQDGVAIVVMLQHAAALDQGAFRRSLKDAGRELSDVEDGAPAEAGHIYLPATNLIVTLKDCRFRTKPADKEHGAGTIDSFLVSLARDVDGRSIAIALAGTGGDGTLGFKAVKEAGGLALAEETGEARADELASSNTPAALADAVLSIDGLVERVASAIRQLFAHDGLPSPEPPEAALATVAAILRNRTGHDFHGYKPGTFLRRIQRRMQVVQVAEIATTSTSCGRRRRRPSSSSTIS